MALQNIRTCPTYVINLDRRKDRWDSFSVQPSLKEFTALKRFSAVDGAKLDLLNDDRVSLHTKQNIIRKYRRSHFEINTPGAIGASFSHIGVWKQFLASDAQHLVVFEDDTIVDAKALRVIDILIPSLPPGWDMWLLGSHRWAFKGSPIGQDKKGWWKVTDFTGAHAYVLSRKGAEMLCANPYPIETHIEYYICGVSQLKGLNIVRHSEFRMGYFQELTDSMDSDTFMNRQSCPVCYIPDDIHDVGFYMSYDKLGRISVGLAALTAVILGGYIGLLRNGKGSA